LCLKPPEHRVDCPFRSANAADMTKQRLFPFITWAVHLWLSSDLSVYPKVDNGRDLDACGANASTTHAQRAARRPKRRPPVKISIPPVNIRENKKPSTNSLHAVRRVVNGASTSKDRHHSQTYSVTRLGDLTWVIRFTRIDNIYEPHWQARVTELKRRASEYTRSRQTQRSLYLLEQLDQVMTMRSRVTTTSNTVPSRGYLFKYWPDGEVLYQESGEELAGLYESCGNLFQAELILEKIVIMKYETLGPRRFCKDVKCSRIIAKLVRLYMFFSERLGKLCADVGADHDYMLSVILIRVARIDINEISNRVLFHEELHLEDSWNTLGGGTCFNVVLHIAAERNACNLAGIALDHGADINNILDSDSYEDWFYLPVIPDNTPLNTALDFKSLDVAKLLITRGADLEARSQTYDGRYGPPLHKAVSLDTIEALFLLLSRGADVDARCEFGQTAFMRAADEENFEAMQLLFKYGAEVNSRRYNSLSALHHAASWPKGLKFLLEAKASVGIRDSIGQTALHLTERVECIDLLLSGGLEVDTRDIDEETALHKASRKGNLAVVRRLLSRGASHLVEGSAGTPLHKAVQHWKWSRNGQERVATVTALLGYGADANRRRPSDGKTPLHVAAVDGGSYLWDHTFLDILEALCAHGADVGIRDNDWKSALDYVRGQEAAIAVLMRYFPMAPVAHQGRGPLDLRWSVLLVKVSLLSYALVAQLARTAWLLQSHPSSEQRTLPMVHIFIGSLEEGWH
ncbi:MAG: hypothetical protein Q9209_006999, partial [Squamulea sp. 1 TL-2023]